MVAVLKCGKTSQLAKLFGTYESEERRFVEVAFLEQYRSVSDAILYGLDSGRFDVVLLSERPAKLDWHVFLYSVFTARHIYTDYITIAANSE